MRGTFVADNHVAVDVEQKPVALAASHVHIKSGHEYPPAICTCESTSIIGTDTRQLEQCISC